MVFPTHSTGFSDALVILGAAGIVVPAFARLRVSPVIGFILVGIAVGPHGLGTLQPRFPWLFHVTVTDIHAIEPFAEFGIVLLLFAIGLELSFRRLWGMRKAVFGVGAAELLLSAGVIGGTMGMLGQSWLGRDGARARAGAVVDRAGAADRRHAWRGRIAAAFAMLLFEDLALVPIMFVLSARSSPSANGGRLGGDRAARCCHRRRWQCWRCCSGSGGYAAAAAVRAGGAREEPGAVPRGQPAHRDPVGDRHHRRPGCRRSSAR